MESKEAAANAKRRRGLGIVTANACTECRKKRAKCDGENPCGRCRNTSSECVYEVPVRQSKETMRLEIESLRNDQQQHQRVMGALMSDDETSQVISQLRNGDSIESIAHGLDHKGHNYQHHEPENTSSMIATMNESTQQAVGHILKPAMDLVASAWPFGSGYPGSSSQNPNSGRVWDNSGAGSSSRSTVYDGPSSDDAMNWTPEHPQGGPPLSLIDTWQQRVINTPETASKARSYGQESILGANYGWEEQSSTYHPNVNQEWTTVTKDGRFVEHIMALYFCWEYPTFASLSKEHFLEDFKNGKTVRCSSLLVNALLALGCRFSDQPSARTDPNRSDTAGDHFFQEALRLLGEDDEHHVLTTVQALGLMSIREASCGRTSKSIYYSGQSIALAMEMGLHRNEEFDMDDKIAATEHAVRAATFWGAFSLDQALSLSIGRLPHFSRKLNVITKPQINDEIEATPWIPYTDNGAPTQLAETCTQPSNVRSVYKTFCELSEFVHRSLYMLYCPGKNVTSHKLATVYHDYCKWYATLPSALRLGQNFTPAVLFAHMHYHYAILLLFRPFIKLAFLEDQESPRDICCQAADAISQLVKSYSGLYSLKRTPSFVPYFVLAATITQMVAFGNSRTGVENLRQGIEDLKEMTSCHGFAFKALDILYFLIGRWEIDVKIEGQEPGIDFKNLCRPMPTSANFFCPNFDMSDIMDGIGPASEENPLFWPFPLQGRPIMDVTALAANGFKVLT